VFCDLYCGAIKHWNLFNTDLLLVTFETDANYLIRFEMKKKTLFAQHTGGSYKNG